MKELLALHGMQYKSYWYSYKHAIKQGKVNVHIGTSMVAHENNDAKIIH